MNKELQKEADKIVNHFMSKGAKVSKLDFDYSFQVLINTVLAERKRLRDMVEMDIEAFSGKDDEFHRGALAEAKDVLSEL